VKLGDGYIELGIKDGKFYKDLAIAEAKMRKVMDSAEMRSVRILGGIGKQFSQVVGQLTGGSAKAFAAMRAELSKVTGSVGLGKTSVSIESISIAAKAAALHTKALKTNLAGTSFPNGRSIGTSIREIASGLREAVISSKSLKTSLSAINGNSLGSLAGSLARVASEAARARRESERLSSAVKAIRPPTVTMGPPKQSGGAGGGGGFSLASLAFSSGLGNLASNAFTGLTSAAYNATAAMFRYSAQTQAALVDFEVLLGSAKQAQPLVAEMTSLAARTPLSLGQVTEVTRMLVSFGRSAADALDEVRMLGDISGGEAERMKRMALAFGQVATKGRLMGQEVLQLTENGFNPLAEISKLTGESIADLSKRMEDGGISFDEFRKAVVAATSAGGRHAGRMEAVGKTLGGAWSQATDGFTQYLSAIGTGLDKTLNLTGFLQSASNGFLFLRDATKEFYEQISPGAAKFRELFSVIGIGSSQSGSMLRDIYRLGGDAFNAVADSAYQFKSQLMGLNVAAGVLSSGVSLAVSTMSYSFRNIGDIGLIAFENVRNAVGSLSSTISAWAQNIASLAGWAAENIVSNFAQALSGVGTLFQNLTGNIAELWSAMITEISTGKEIKPNLKPLIEGFKLQLSPLPGLVASQFKSDQGLIDAALGNIAAREAELRNGRPKSENEKLAGGSGSSTDSTKGDGKDKSANRSQFVSISDVVKNLQQTLGRDLAQEQLNVLKGIEKNTNDAGGKGGKPVDNSLAKSASRIGVPPTGTDQKQHLTKLSTIAEYAKKQQAAFDQMNKSLSALANKPSTFVLG
jgi:tape measure domain-containing protein